MPHGQDACLVRIISLLKDCLAKEKIGRNLKKKKKLQYWTNSFIPLNTSQVSLFHGVRWQMFLCVRIKAQSQLHLYRKIIISIIVWQWDTVTRRKSSSGFDFTKPCKICDTKFAYKGKPKLNHFYTKVICILSCIDCPTLSYYPSCSFREFFLPLPRLVLPG